MNGLLANYSIRALLIVIITSLYNTAIINSWQHKSVRQCANINRMLLFQASFEYHPLNIIQYSRS